MNNENKNNNLIKYFLNNIDFYSSYEKRLKNFFEVVNYDKIVYKISKGEEIEYSEKCYIYNYNKYILKLIDKDIVCKYIDIFYKEVTDFLINFINDKFFVSTKYIYIYFLYNAIYNICKNSVFANINIDDRFLSTDYIYYVQIHKNSLTPMPKIIFNLLLKKPFLVSRYFKYYETKKYKFNQNNLFILEVIANYDMKENINKKVKNFCKIVNKENIYDLIFN